MILVLSLASSLAVTVIPAQGSRGKLPAVVDSGKTLKYVRSAQASFESFRRTRLPYGESSYGRDCDAHVGRWCYWREEEPDDDKGPDPEPPAVRDRRASLIGILDSVAHVLPGDSWVAGQRVRYLVEAERTDDALKAAAECRADAWWCAALGGYAAHVAERFDVADSLYTRALDAMPEAQRCKWVDISGVVEDDLADRLKNKPCAERATLSRRIYWLGAPLWSVSQSDQLTEHYARLTQLLIAERSASPQGMIYASDMRALVIRYGWSRWFTRSDASLGNPYDPPITGHDGGTAYYFLPSARMLDSGSSVQPDWRLDYSRAVSGYAPSYARSVHELSGQVASFRRGDSTLVVGAWDVRRDSTLVGRSLNAALVLAAPGDVRGFSRSTERPAVGRIEATALIDTGWISLEVLAPKEHRAGRLRVGLTKRSTGRVALSDLLFYAPMDRQVDRLAIARDSALTAAVVPFNRNLGVFYETYGLAPQGEHLRFQLTVEQVSIGWRQRAAEHLRLSDPTAAIHIQWEEMASVANGINGHGQRVDLSTLRSGRYRMALQVTADDGATATTSREIEVRDK
ncbi:MAG TPA: hypothetical protein VGM50_02035 [Gemmatimonadaceae bacterium]|jgi:hypothetical protein